MRGLLRGMCTSSTNQPKHQNNDFVELASCSIVPDRKCQTPSPISKLIHSSKDQARDKMAGPCAPPVRPTTPCSGNVWMGHNLAPEPLQPLDPPGRVPVARETASPKPPMAHDCAFSY